MTDNINHPAHYNDGKIEVIEFIEDKNLNFHLGNAVKYIARAGKKDPHKHIEDLEKATWYLNREIEILKSKQESRTPKRPNDMNLPATFATAASNLRTQEAIADTAANAQFPGWVCNYCHRGFKFTWESDSLTCPRCLKLQEGYEWHKAEMIKEKLQSNLSCEGSEP